jgi:hypothetical protein
MHGSSSIGGTYSLVESTFRTRPLREAYPGEGGLNAVQCDNVYSQDTGRPIDTVANDKTEATITH